MSNDSLVSVVIPVHGELPYLEATMASVRRQTYPNLDVILVDDRANLDVVRRCLPIVSDARIVKSMGKNSSRARNTGLQHAHGEWIAFLDSDDIWHPAKLERQILFSERFPHAQVICCSFAEYEDSRVTLLRPLRRRFVSGDAIRAVLLDDIAIPSAAICKTEAVKAAGGWVPDVQQFEDTLFFAQLAMLVPFAFLDEALVLYRKHEGNRSAHHSFGRLEARMAVAERLKSAGFELSRQLLREYEAHAYTIASHWHRKANRRGQAGLMALNAFRARPQSLGPLLLGARTLLPPTWDKWLRRRVAPAMSSQMFSDRLLSEFFGLTGTD